MDWGEEPKGADKTLRQLGLVLQVWVVLAGGNWAETGGWKPLFALPLRGEIALEEEGVHGYRGDAGEPARLFSTGSRTSLYISQVQKV